MIFSKNCEKTCSQINMTIKENIDINIERINQYAMYNIVVSKLFLRIKFLDKNKDLDFSRGNGTISHYVFQICNLKYEQGEEAVL